MKELLLTLARDVREVVRGFQAAGERRILRRHEGDPHFEVDDIAENLVRTRLAEWPISVALFSEDQGLVHVRDNPEWILIVDPIDGTRPAMAGFESACFSVAVAPYSQDPRFSDITMALVLELATGDYFYADAETWESSHRNMPTLSRRAEMDAMFWSLELTAHPVHRLMQVYGDLVNGSVTRGGVFVFTSSSYSLTRIITGQLDAHVDIGHGILRKYPDLAAEFRQVGCGKVVTLYSYDIVGAAYLLKRCGGVVSDAFGAPLDNMPLLTDKSVEQQCSLIAASNETLHQSILSQLRWDQIKPL